MTVKVATSPMSMSTGFRQASPLAKLVTTADSMRRKTPVLPRVDNAGIRRPSAPAQGTTHEDAFRALVRPSGACRPSAAGAPLASASADDFRPMEPPPGLTLEEDNEWLRAELARLKTEAAQQVAIQVNGAMHRRSMAMVAGGGFRGPSQRKVDTACCCDSLRTQLAACKEALREAREALRRQVALAEDSAAISEELRASISSQPASPSFPEVQCAETQTEEAPKLLDAEAQTTPCTLRQTATASTQATPERVEAADATSQTPPPLLEERPVLADFSVQHSPEIVECEVQASMEAVTAVAQTDPEPLPEPGPELESQSVQTEPEPETKRQSATVPIQTDAPVKAACVDAETQSIPHRPSGSRGSSHRGVQCVRKCIERESQTMDLGEDEELERLRAALQASEYVVDDLGIENSRLQASERALEEKARIALTQVSTWQKAAQQNVFGSLNVMVVCPKAECTVRGEHLDMSCWDLPSIQRLIEAEVIPRFTRVFSYEGEEQPSSVKDAIDSAMQEFAQTFRAKLAEMLLQTNPKAPVKS